MTVRPRCSPIVCLITDRRRLPDPGGINLVRLSAAAAAAGIDLLQIREPDLHDHDLLTLVRQVQAAVAGTAAAVLVNERTDVALAAGAHGVHLRSTSVSAARVRTLVPEGFVIGRSVHDVAELSAEAPAADLVVMGTVFRTASKPGVERTVGVEGLAAVCRASPVPVLAVGGVRTDNVADVAAAGAAGFAAIGLFADLLGATPAGRLEAEFTRLLTSLRQRFGAAADRRGGAA